MDPLRVFVWPFAKMQNDELVSWLRDSATLQEAHPFHKLNWVDWNPGALRFRQHADSIAAAQVAMENKDPGATKKRDQEHADALRSIDLNATYLLVRARAENNDSLIHNCGYTVKDNTKNNAGHVSLSEVPLSLHLKNEGPGAVAVSYTRDPAAALYQLQWCKGAPGGEDCWQEGGLHKSSRPVVRGLDRASWYYFRVRGHGDNKPGPWCAPVGIVVT